MFIISPNAGQAINITGKIFEIAFVCILSYLMLDVNKQLAIFFDLVAVKNYAKKSLTFIFAVNFLVVI